MITVKRIYEPVYEVNGLREILVENTHYVLKYSDGCH